MLNLQCCQPICAREYVQTPSTRPSGELHRSRRHTDWRDDSGIVAKVEPAVCVVTASDDSGKTRDFGTGFFVSQDGFFVTNKHVIEGAEQVTIKASNGDKFTCTGILAEPPGTDLAVLKIDASGMTKAELGSSTDLVEGQRVLVIGTPEGLEGTVSDGIVAAIRSNPRMIQITAPISPGSSGSPVLDETGKVIGIATRQFKRAEPELRNSG